jgi:hypothetical protein
MSDDRILEAIRKARAIMAAQTNEVKKQKMKETIDAMDTIYKEILKNKIPCPPELEKDVDAALSGIEKMYNDKVAN